MVMVGLLFLADHIDWWADRSRRRHWQNWRRVVVVRQTAQSIVVVRIVVRAVRIHARTRSHGRRVLDMRRFGAARYLGSGAGGFTIR